MAIAVAIGVYIAGGPHQPAGRTTPLARAAVLAGAVANLAGDGWSPTTCTGWWPNFNLADTLPCFDVAGLILTNLRRHLGTVDPSAAVTSPTSTPTKDPETAQP